MCAGLLDKVQSDCYACWTFIQGTTLVVMYAGLLDRVQPWLLYVLDFYTGYNLAVMSVGLVYSLQPWLLYVLNVYTEYNLGCYVCWPFIQSTNLVVMCAGLLDRVQP